MIEGGGGGSGVIAEALSARGLGLRWMRWARVDAFDDGAPAGGVIRSVEAIEQSDEFFNQAAMLKAAQGRGEVGVRIIDGAQEERLSEVDHAADHQDLGPVAGGFGADRDRGGGSREFFVGGPDDRLGLVEPAEIEDATPEHSLPF